MTSTEYGHHFSVKNIPFGIVSSEKHSSKQAATRIENNVIFLNDLAQVGLFKSVEGLTNGVFAESSLNNFAELPKSVVAGVRKAIQDAVISNGVSSLPSGSVEEVSKVTMHMPVEVKDFVDFSCSVYHNRNMGQIVMKNPKPPPGFYYCPSGYQGRAASIVVSGTPVKRPWGYVYDPKAKVSPGEVPPIIYGPSQGMDYEVEFSAVIGRPLPLGKGLNAVDADAHIFGFVLLNDWSVRDVQAIEMRALGPLNSKNVTTTISPWIITLEALEPFVMRGPAREKQAAPYMNDPEEKTYNVDITVDLTPKGASKATVIAKCQLQHVYWSSRQMVAHIVAGGASLRSGDILATGTCSGPEQDTFGCLMETTHGGTKPVVLNEGGSRASIDDGDVIRMTAIAGGDSSGVGFGECVGTLLPADTSK